MRNKSKTGILPLVLLGLAFIVIAVPNLRLYSKPTSYNPDNTIKNVDIVKQLEFIRSSINDGAANRMQKIYPEGYFFLHVVYGLAWSELALSTSDTLLKEKALLEATFSLQRIESREGFGIFDDQLHPKYGVFYAGWTNYLRARIIQLRGISRVDSTILKNYQDDCKILGDLYAKSNAPYLPSYEGMGWPGDNIIAIFALHLHDGLFPRQYREIIASWMGKVKRCLDQSSGMPPFEINTNDQQIVKNTRGSAQALFLKYVAQMDPEFAEKQYSLYKKAFLTTRLGIPLVREYPKGTKGPGDYDSGPVIWDIGSTATIVSLATLRMYKDTLFANALEQSIEMLGFPITYRNKTKYAFGLMPMGDVFLAWSKTSIPVIDTPDKAILNPNWRIAFHLLSVLVLLIIGLPLVLLSMHRQKG